MVPYAMSAHSYQSINILRMNKWMTQLKQNTYIEWVASSLLLGKKKKTAWESDPLAGPLSLTIQYNEEEKTKVSLPYWHFPSTGCIHQFLKVTAIKLLTMHRLPRKPGRDGRGRDGVGTGGSKHSCHSSLKPWVLKPMSSSTNWVPLWTGLN